MIWYFDIGTSYVTLIALFIRFILNFIKENNDYKNTSKREAITTTILFNYPYKKNDDNMKNCGDNDLIDPKISIAIEILDSIILCISIIVVEIPEGLPLTVTLPLAFSIKKMRIKIIQ